MWGDVCIETNSPICYVNGLKYINFDVHRTHICIYIYKLCIN